MKVRLYIKNMFAYIPACSFVASRRSYLYKLFPLDIIKEKNRNNRQHAEKLQHKHPRCGAHGKKHEHKNGATHQHIVVDGTHYIKVSNLLPVLQFHGPGNMKPIRYHNPRRIGWHGNQDGFVFTEIVNVHSVHHQPQFQKLQQHMVFLNNHDLVLCCWLNALRL